MEKERCRAMLRSTEKKLESIDVASRKLSRKLCVTRRGRRMSHERHSGSFSFFPREKERERGREASPRIVQQTATSHAVAQRNRNLAYRIPPGASEFTRYFYSRIKAAISIGNQFSRGVDETRCYGGNVSICKESKDHSYNSL